MNKYVVDELNPYFPRSQFSETVQQVQSALEERAGVERLHLLVIGTANLEAYLQDATRLYVAALGHDAGGGQLTPVGAALARPIVRSSTVPDMVSYLQELLKINVSKHLDRWKVAYKLRNAAAHNGGIATARVLRDIPTVKVPRNQSITLSWKELMGYLESADAIAEEADKAISLLSGVHLIEAVWLIEEWKSSSVLPLKKDLWRDLHRLGFPKFSKARKSEIEAKFYP
ncbi:hypothetical protein [Myxococcus fulvus]|nr:hypothetical protein [Myxococcus fulvus]